MRCFGLRRMLLGVLPSLLVVGCAARPGDEARAPVPPDPRAKIEFDLDALDADGLRGPADGKVAVAYELVVPDTAAARGAVERIDASIEWMPGSRGRIGAGPGQCLGIGSTHQPRHRDVLLALARLPEVGRIIECHHE